MSNDDISQLMAISGKPREVCVMALILGQGNVEMACSVIFELTPEQMVMAIQQARAQLAGGMGEEDDDFGMGGGMAGMAGAGMGGGAGVGGGAPA